MAIKGFIKNMDGVTLLPVTRGELVKDQWGQCAFSSNEFLAEAPSATSNGHPGLMTASEKALLSGSGTNGLKDLYTQLQAIDNHLKVTGTLIPLSTKELNIVSSDDSGITAKLTETTTNKYELEFVLNNIIKDKALENVIVQTVDETNAAAVVNKQYVDNKFNSSMDVATGALKFVGLVSTADDLIDYMTQNAVGSYFKATKAIIIPPEKDYQGTGFTTKVGDTLIIANKSGAIRIAHIPSGNDDDTILFIGTTPLIGNHTLSASAPLSITKTNNIINLGITPATDTTAGYLTLADYKAFKAASQKEITYENAVTNGIAIGTLNNDIDITIPKLKLTTNGANGVIQYEGHDTNKIIVTGLGIAVGVDSGSLVLAPNIADSSTDHLYVDDGKIHLNVWSADGENKQDLNSLITLGAFASGVVNHVEFTPIANQTSLTLTPEEANNLK